MLRLIANIIWFILGGIWTSLAWAVLGVLLCITIVGIPFGLQCFKAASLTFFPFGKKVVLHFGRHPVANTLWAIFFGWELAIFYFVIGVMQMVTIFGIPSGWQCFKLMKLALFPFGATINQ